QRARLLVRGVEDDGLETSRSVLQPQEHHRVASLRRHVTQARDDAADRDRLAVAAAVELRDRRVRLAAQLVTDPRERMLRDVEAEHLLLQAKQLVLLELAARNGRVVTGTLLPCVAFYPRRPEVEDRALAGEPFRLLLLPPRDCLLEHLEHALARARQRAAFDERLEHALVRDRRVDALGEIPDRLERAALLPR